MRDHAPILGDEYAGRAQKHRDRAGETVGVARDQDQGRSQLAYRLHRRRAEYSLVISQGSVDVHRQGPDQSFTPSVVTVKTASRSFSAVAGPTPGRSSSNTVAIL